MIPRYFYSSFISQHLDVNLLLDYLIKIEENDEIVPSVIDLFINNLINSISEESHYVLVKMLERNLINSYTFKNIQDKYLWRYKNNEKNKFSSLLIRNYEEFSRNDFELHKKYVEEGVNLDEISKIIRNDDIEKLQEKSSQPNFDINHIIEPSLYERCSFINKDNVTLIDYAAFFSAVKCFKYLLMNGAKVNNTGKYAIAGGNEEIIHLCEQNHSSFEDAYETAIQYHQNEIFKYLYENKINEIEDLSNLGIECIKYDNYILFSFLEEKGMKINEQIAKMSAENGNAFIIKTFTETHQTPNYFLPNLIKQGNIEIIKLLLEQEGIDINATCIYLFYLIFILIIFYFKIIFRNYSNYFKQHL